MEIDLYNLIGIRLAGARASCPDAQAELRRLRAACDEMERRRRLKAQDDHGSLRNSTTQTNGLASQDPEPLMLSQSSA